MTSFHYHSFILIVIPSDFIFPYHLSVLPTSEFMLHLYVVLSIGDLRIICIGGQYSEVNDVRKIDIVHEYVEQKAPGLIPGEFLS